MAGLLLAVCASAQILGYNMEVKVSLDRANWTYKVGETAVFNIVVTQSGTPLPNAKVDIEAGPEMYPDIKRNGVQLKDGSMKMKAAMKQPGFYRVKVTTHIGEKDYTGVCTAAFSPEKLKPTTVNPSDFDSFWNGTLEKARQIPLNPHKRLLPERCTDKANVYEVDFQNDRDGSRIYGILCVPVKPGKYPALLRVPGAGCRPYAGDIWTAEQGVITLEIGIHGVPVTMNQQIYDRMFNTSVRDYWNINMDSRDNCYYKHVFTGALRSIDYIASLDAWDGKNLGVAGSSQGGMLSIVCAALDKRVTCYAPVHAAMCDHTASLKGVACGWPHYFFYDKAAGKNKDRVETSRYYDGVNFARRITCPGWYSFGYNDDVVPPTTAFATYNTVTAPKELHLYQHTAHYWSDDQWNEWEGWLLKQLGVKE